MLIFPTKTFKIPTKPFLEQKRETQRKVETLWPYNIREN